MNRAYRIVWSAARGAWVAVCEIARAHGKNGRSSVVRTARKAGVAVAGAMLGVSLAHALPEGGQIVGGSGGISQSGSAMTVQQDSARMAIDWQKFGINANELVRFNQPSSSAIALNRVLGNNPSAIYGQLQANGKIFLVNPSGILFAPGSRVDVGGLVASTLNINSADFMAGRYQFRKDGSAGSIVNQGDITAADGGYVALLAPEVRNEGVIAARLGTVAMAAGDSVSLSLNDGAVGIQIDEAALNASITNRNAVRAEDGVVILSARAKDALLNTVINNEGVIEAKRVTNRGGVIRLEGGSSGVVSVSGTLDASGKAAGQTGGQVAVLGERVLLTGAARVDASGDQGGGTILVGGDLHGGGGVPTARETYVGADVRLNADAIQNGDGGKVVVWADDRTRYLGNISSRGGENSGNGGFVEVSGKQTLEFVGGVELGSGAGVGGTLLLDPYDLIIGTTGTAIPDNGVPANPDIAFADGNTTVGNSTTYIYNTTVANYSLLYLQAGNNITVSTAMNMACGSSVKLEANHSILVGSTITVNGNLTTAPGSITLTAGLGGNTSSVINVNSALAVTANSSLTPGSINLNVQNGTLNLNAALTTKGGAVNINATTVATTAAGTITTSGESNNSGSCYSKAGGNVSVNATGNVTLRAITADGGATTGTNLTIGSRAGDISILGGNITLSGVLSANGSQADYGPANLSNLTSTGIGFHGGDGGNITVNATGNLTATAIIASRGGSGLWNPRWDLSAADVSRGGRGGDITLYTSGGFINATANITSVGSPGTNAANLSTPGKVTIRNDWNNAGGYVNVSNVTMGVGVAGIRYNNGTNATNSGAGARTGDVVITALASNISTKNISTAGANTLVAGQDSGSVTILTGNAARDYHGLSNSTSYTGGNINITGNISTLAGAAGSNIFNTTANSSDATVGYSQNWGTNSTFTKGGAGGAVNINATNGSVNITGNTTAVIVTAGGGANQNANANITIAPGGAAGAVSIAGTGVSLGSALVACTTANNSYLVINASGRDSKNTTGGAAGLITINGGTGAVDLLANSSLNGTTANAAGTRFTDFVIASCVGKSDGASSASGTTGGVNITGATVRVPHVFVSGAIGANNSAGGNAGYIRLNATAGNVTLSGNLTAVGGARAGTAADGVGGEVTITASNGILLQNISNSSSSTYIKVVGGNNHTGGNVTLTGALYETPAGSSQNLYINASNSSVVTLLGSSTVDSTNALTNLFVNATGSGGANGSDSGMIIVGNVTTTGAQTYDAGSTGNASGVRIGLQGNIVTTGTAGADTVSFGDAITLLANSSITTGSVSNGATDSITINQTVNGNKNLILNSGANAGVIISSTIGGLSRLNLFNATGKTVTYNTLACATSIFGRATGGDVVLGANGKLDATTNAGTNNASIELVASGNFTNGNGSSALANGAGRFLVWSTNPTDTSIGGITADFKQYNATYGVSTPAESNNTNGFLYTTAPTLTGTLSGVTKEYDGTLNASITQAELSVSGTQAGDTVNATFTTQGLYDNANFGLNNRTVTVSTFNNVTNGTTRVYGYSTSISTNSSSITKRNVGVVGTRAYDGTANFNTADVTGFTNLVSGQTLTMTSGSGTIGSKNAGVNGTMASAGSFSLGDGTGGGLASNYQINVSASTNTITKKSVVLTATRAYDGSTDLNFGDVTGIGGLVGTETITVASGAGTIANKNAGVNGTMTGAGTLALGNGTNDGLADNYQIGSGTNTITKKSVGVTGTRAYDGSANFNSSDVTGFTGVVSGENLTMASGTGTIANKNAGVNGTMTSIGTLALGNGTGGGLADNYQINASASTNTVTKKSVGVTGARIYDASTNFNASDVTGFTGLISGEGLNMASGTGTIASKNVGGNGTMASVGTLTLGNGSGGGLADNYQINASASTNTLSKANLTVSGLTAQNKVYDTTTAATLTGTATAPRTPARARRSRPAWADWASAARTRATTRSTASAAASPPISPRPALP
ncbi:MAG: filamentous hemagglutinin N-terminal domain-containing protein [Betaproteobacteria bacterium]|nr:filamentous hemagglutinin N-terminal domain-containing protein [Betaproteobacteria bacterium]